MLDSPVKFEDQNSINIIKKNEELIANKVVRDKSYNAYEYLITKEEIEKIASHQNVLFIIQSKVPSFQANQNNNTMSFHRGSTGSSNNGEPLIIIDGLPVNVQLSNPILTTPQPTQKQAVRIENQQYNKDGNNNDNSQVIMNNQVPTTEFKSENSVNDILRNISTKDVSQIEITTKFDPRFGPSGANGVISIKTANSISKRSNKKTFDIFTIDGYSIAAPFVLSEEMTQTDHVSSATLYWNPSINIGSNKETQISFLLPKNPNQYLIRIEGVSLEGKPVEGSIQFNIQKIK